MFHPDTLMDLGEDIQLIVRRQEGKIDGNSSSIQSPFRKIQERETNTSTQLELSWGFWCNREGTLEN